MNHATWWVLAMLELLVALPIIVAGFLWAFVRCAFAIGVANYGRWVAQQNKELRGE